MTYDWLNRQTNWADGAKSETTVRYLYDGDNVCADYNAAKSLTKFYVTPMLDQNLSMTVTTGTNAGTYYYTQDGLGSVRTLTGASNATLQNTYAYNAFGEAFAATTNETISQRYQYTGRESTTNPELMYYRYRFYSSCFGRFSRRDPIGYKAGGNLYTYVANSPTILIDYYGLIDNETPPSHSITGLELAKLYKSGKSKKLNERTDAEVETKATEMCKEACTKAKKQFKRVDKIDEDWYWLTDKWSDWIYHTSVYDHWWYSGTRSVTRFNWKKNTYERVTTTKYVKYQYQYEYNHYMYEYECYCCDPETGDVDQENGDYYVFKYTDVNDIEADTDYEESTTTTPVPKPR